jgi:hypothetical protein
MPSPIEAQFMAAWQRHFPHLPLVTEFPVYNGRYRIDFAHPPTKVAVELDGYDYHNDRNTFTNDRQRDRALQRDGWRVLHFSGREIYQNVDACVHEVYAVIAQQPFIMQPVLVPPPQPHASWSNTMLSEQQLFGSRRSRKRTSQGCITAFAVFGVLLLTMCTWSILISG